MEKINTTTEKISDALKLLDEAAKNKKSEIQEMLANRYQNIKDTISGFDSKESLDSAKQSASDVAGRAKELSEEKVKEIATQVDQNVHSNPWPYIGGAALCSLLLGYIMGRKD